MSSREPVQFHTEKCALEHLNLTALSIFFNHKVRHRIWCDLKSLGNGVRSIGGDASHSMFSYQLREIDLEFNLVRVEVEFCAQ